MPKTNLHQQTKTSNLTEIETSRPATEAIEIDVPFGRHNKVQTVLEIGTRRPWFSLRDLCRLEPLGHRRPDSVARGIPTQHRRLYPFTSGRRSIVIDLTGLLRIARKRRATEVIAWAYEHFGRHLVEPAPEAQPLAGLGLGMGVAMGDDRSEPAPPAGTEPPTTEPVTEPPTTEPVTELVITPAQEQQSEGPRAPFRWNGHDVRVARIDDGGGPWFVARDVGDALGLVTVLASTALLAAEDRGIDTVDTLGGPQQMVTINESGLYELTFRSRRPEARAFCRWVTGTVLPEIRRTGSYSRPGALPPGVEVPQGLTAGEWQQVLRALSSQDDNHREVIEMLQRILEQQRELLRTQHANAMLGRFPEVEALHRAEVKMKLRELVDVVAASRGWATSLIWQEIYATIKRLFGHDVRREAIYLTGRTLLDRADQMGILEITYRTARHHFQGDVIKIPRLGRHPSTEVLDLPSGHPTVQDLVNELMGTTTGSTGSGESGSGESGSDGSGSDGDDDGSGNDPDPIT